MDFNDKPLIVIWETTRACDLACAHCRATAQLNPMPGELSTMEGVALIDEIAAMGAPVLVLSGGDPLKRPDLGTLIRRGKMRGLRMGTIPAATPSLTRDAVQRLKDVGLDQMALSLDASSAEGHDAFRGVPGAFEKTMQAVEWAHEAGLPLQINTVVRAGNFDDFDRMMELVERLGIVFWEVFFLVPMGRGAAMQGLTAMQYEAVFAKLYSLGRRVGFIIKVTEAPHYRRYCAVRARRESNGRGGAGHAPSTAHWHVEGPGGSIGLAPQGVNAGKGHLFIAYNGDIYPSGFLPLSAGNVRTSRVSTVYQTSNVFLSLRNPDLLGGRCGRCEFRRLCGGSRARAYAVTGDYLAEEPCCAYEPTVQITPYRKPDTLV